MRAGGQRVATTTSHIVICDLPRKRCNRDTHRSFTEEIYSYISDEIGDNAQNPVQHQKNPGKVVQITNRLHSNNLRTAYRRSQRKIKSNLEIGALQQSDRSKYTEECSPDSFEPKKKAVRSKECRPESCEPGKKVVRSKEDLSEIQDLKRPKQTKDPHREQADTRSRPSKDRKCHKKVEFRASRRTTEGGISSPSPSTNQRATEFEIPVPSIRACQGAVEVGHPSPKLSESQSATKFKIPAPRASTKGITESQNPKSRTDTEGFCDTESSTGDTETRIPRSKEEGTETEIGVAEKQKPGWPRRWRVGTRWPEQGAVGVVSPRRQQSRGERHRDPHRATDSRIRRQRTPHRIDRGDPEVKVSRCGEPVGKHRSCRAPKGK